MFGNTVLFGPVGPEVLIILLLVVLLFGANRIPKLARSSGQAITEFQRGRKGSEENEPTSETAADSSSNDTKTNEQTTTETARANQ